MGGEEVQAADELRQAQSSSKVRLKSVCVCVLFYLQGPSMNVQRCTCDFLVLFF